MPHLPLHWACLTLRPSIVQVAALRFCRLRRADVQQFVEFRRRIRGSDDCDALLITADDYIVDGGVPLLVVALYRDNAVSHLRKSVFGDAARTARGAAAMAAAGIATSSPSGARDASPFATGFGALSSSSQSLVCNSLLLLLSS